MTTTSTNTTSTTAETMAASSTPTKPTLTSSIKTATISATVQRTSTGFTMPFEAQITVLTEPELTPSTCLYTCITTEKSTTTETSAAGCTSADHSLTNSIDTITTSATVQPTSTGFTIFYEPPPSSPSLSPPPSPTETVEPETTPNTSLSTSITAEESTTTETIAAASTPADPSSTNSIDTVITRAIVQPKNTGFTMSFEPSSPPPSSSLPPQTTTVEPESTSSTFISTNITAEEPRILYTRTSAKTTDTEQQGITTVIPSPQRIQPINTSSVTATVGANIQSPSVDTTVSCMTTNLPVTTSSATASFSVTTESPWTRDTMTPATSNTSRSLQATSSFESFRRVSSLMDSLKNCPKDLGFNVFLDGLAAEITNEDLNRLKHYVIGENGIGYGTLEKIETALEFFTILRRRNILTRDNIIFLQVLLWHLKRQDLHRKCVEYARNFGNATYFYTPSPEPENGYRYVRFHVVSNEFVDFDRRRLENIRTAIAELLLVPPQFVFVSGLEPSSSLIITFMIPEYYVSLLIEMVVDYRTPQLLDVGIDKIYYDGKLYHLQGKASNESILGKFRGKLEDREELLERLHRAETWLDQREKEVIELSRFLDKAERDLHKVKKEKAENKFVEICTFQTKSVFACLESFIEKESESGLYTEDHMKLSDGTRSLICSKSGNKCKHIRHKSCSWILPGLNSLIVCPNWLQVSKSKEEVFYPNST